MSFITATGNLGRDAELTTANGHKLLKFSIADEIGYGDKKSTQWLRCTIWGKRAESLAQYLTKGSMVEICGTPKVNSYQTKAGEFRAEIEVSVLELKLRGGGKAERQEAPADDMDSGEIPF